MTPEHRWAAGSMYWHNGCVWMYDHNSCPFGAKASVFNWERVGRCLRAVARRLLHSALFEYVDDYFAAEHPGVVEHAMVCFSKVVKVLLGEGTIAAEKLVHGKSLKILKPPVQL